MGMSSVIKPRIAFIITFNNNLFFASFLEIFQKKIGMFNDAIKLKGNAIEILQSR